MEKSMTSQVPSMHTKLTIHYLASYINMNGLAIIIRHSRKYCNMKNKKWKSGEGERERKKSYWKENNKDIFKMYKLHN